MHLQLFEDREADQELVRKALEGIEDVTVVSTLPPPDLDLARVLDNDAEIFLIDYELDTKQEGGPVANYKGPALAGALKVHRPEHPLILLTRRSLVAWTERRRTVQATALFDDELFKDDLEKDPETFARRLKALAAGFAELRAQKGREPTDVWSLLGADEAVQSDLGETAPPQRGWAAAEIAGWVRGVLFEYPGVLYDSLSAGVLLGLDVDSFLDGHVQELVQSAAYSGVFRDVESRWWKHKLLDIAATTSAEQELEGPIGETFKQVIEKLSDREFRQPECVVSGKPADWVCHVLHAPVRIEYSLPYHPDRRPSTMDEARVSFKAIRESNDVMDEYFDASSAAMLPEIRS